MRRQLSALLLANPCGALERQAVAEAQHPRTDPHSEHHRDDHDGPDRLAETVLDTDRVQQRRGSERHEQRAGEQAGERRARSGGAAAATTSGAARARSHPPWPPAATTAPCRRRRAPTATGPHRHASPQGALPRTAPQPRTRSAPPHATRPCDDRSARCQAQPESKPTPARRGQRRVHRPWPSSRRSRARAEPPPRGVAPDRRTRLPADRDQCDGEGAGETALRAAPPVPGRKPSFNHASQFRTAGKGFPLAWARQRARRPPPAAAVPAAGRPPPQN